MTSVVAIAGSFTVWAVVHSVLAGLRFKALVRRLAGPGVARWYRLLTSEFGEAYSIYQRQVPRFLPLPGRRFERG